LRERRDDIPLLVAHFLKGKVNSQTNRPFQVTRQAMDILCAHEWPGNVRELENAIERAATLCEGEVIKAEDLPPSMVASVKITAPSQDSGGNAALPSVPESALYPLHLNSSPDGAPAPKSAADERIIPLKDYLREQEHAYLNRVMERCSGDKEQAAIVLGVSLATLYRKLSGEEKDQ
jgi:DNA-binding NtrC family response regulator